MSSLQKFKILATQCAVVSGTPTQSPTTSPVIHLRRRKTLRMFLSRTSDHHRRRFSRRDNNSDDIDPSEKKKVRRKLKDLFVSSPPFEDKENNNHNTNRDENDDDVDLNNGNGNVTVSSENRESGFNTARRNGAGLRPLSGTLRYRLLRRAWRPVLVTIPE